MALVATAACGGGEASAPTPPPPLPPTPALAGATASVSALTLAVGQSGALTITATIAAGATATVALASANPAVAIISGSAGQYTVTAVSPGSTTLTAVVSAVGPALASASRTLDIPVTVVAPVVVTLMPGTLALRPGASGVLTVAVSGGATIPTVQACTSSNVAVATTALRGSTCTVTAVGPDSAVLEVTSGGARGSALVTVTVPPPNAACRLPSRTGSVAFGFPRNASRLRSTGTVRATVLFVDFSDAPAMRTTHGVLNIIQPTAGTFFTAHPYGAMSLVLEPQQRWLRMSRLSTQYGWPNDVTFESHRLFLQDAADLAAPFTDMSAADLLVVMTNPDAGAITFGPAFVPNTGGGIRVPWRATSIDNATNSGRALTGWGGLWLAHEMGHLLSLPDLYDFAPPTPAQTHLHVGEWSIMGFISGRGGEFSAFERWQLGWLADEQLVCAPAATSLACFIDTQVASGRGTMRVLPFADTDQSKLTRALTPGQSVTLGGVNITLVSRTEGSDVVRVVRP